jgi:hypothetical protein
MAPSLIYLVDAGFSDKIGSKQINDAMKASIEGLKGTALLSWARPETRLKVFGAIRKVAEELKDPNAINAIRYLASEGPEEVSAAAKKWLREHDGSK